MGSAAPPPAPVAAACAEKEVFGDVLDLMDESGMCMDSSDEDENTEEAAPAAAPAPVEPVPAPTKETSPLIEEVCVGKCVPVTDVAPVPPKAEEAPSEKLDIPEKEVAAPASLSAAPPPAPVAAACAEKEVFGDVLDLMDESGMCMDSDSDNEESENTSSGDISDLSTESLSETL